MPKEEDDWTNVLFGSVTDDMWTRGQVNYWYLNPFRFQLTASIGPFEIDLSVTSKKSDCLYYPASILSAESYNIVEIFSADGSSSIRAALFILPPYVEHIVDYIDDNNELIEGATFFGSANRGLQTNQLSGLFYLSGYLNNIDANNELIQHQFIYTFPNIVVRRPFFNIQPYLEVIEDPVPFLTEQVVINNETTYTYNLQLMKAVGSSKQPRYDKANWFYDGIYPTINSAEFTFL